MLVRDLLVGDEVLLRNGKIVAVQEVLLAEVVEQVSNFHVAELQNDAVGSCGVLVHNTNDPPTSPAAYKFKTRGISYSSEVVKNADGSSSIVHYATKDGTRHVIGYSVITKEGQLTNAFEVPKEFQQLDLSKRMYAEAERVSFKSTAGQYHTSSDNFKEFYKVYDPANANEVEALLLTPAGKVAKQSGMKPTQIKVGPDKVEVV
ncbi:unnamed protein product [Tuwongella immobilis]|uniref:Intein C-terminal splicing domain-containing protein n=1 Tax=Tuwongella immobilis TaxID=692036 RepID=A0A6C2YGX0_9BACT|nr:unnamed protein product [Tuwongella immobilis]VTR96934.1 unnamed protein product [Tuwongella immobilis]